MHSQAKTSIVLHYSPLVSVFSVASSSNSTGRSPARCCDSCFTVACIESTRSLTPIATQQPTGSGWLYGRVPLLLLLLLLLLVLVVAVVVVAVAAHRVAELALLCRPLVLSSCCMLRAMSACRLTSRRCLAASAV